MSANQNNSFGQFQESFLRNWGQSNPVDFQKIAQLQQNAIDSMNQANKALFDGFQKLFKSQSEFMQEQAQVAANIASKTLSAQTPEAAIDTQTRFAQHYFDANLQNAQNVAKSASDTSVKVFDILNRQAVENLNELSRTAKKKAS